MEEVRINERLSGRVWKTERPRASVVIVHGYGEHSGRYTALAEYFASKGVSTLAFDYRGHGKSEGKRGLILRWSGLRSDLDAAVGFQSGVHPDVPLFILGHSVGGTVTLDYVLNTSQVPRGIIISAPALGTPGLSAFKLAAAKVISAIAPKMIFNLGLDNSALSRDPAECQKYLNDPLVHGKACARLSTELSKVQQLIFRQARQFFPVPLLMTYGDADRIAPAEPIQEFFDSAECQDKVLQIFPGAYHELHNDTVRDEVFRLYADWMLERI